MIAGGTAAITADVEVAIRALLPYADVRRIAGETRCDTSQQLSDLLRDDRGE